MSQRISLSPHWDERIPNEPIARRQFEIMQGPNLAMTYPGTTSLCKAGQATEWLLYDKDSEITAATYWLAALKGAPALPNKLLSRRDYKRLLKAYPHKPWLYGITKDTEAESALLGLVGARKVDPQLPAGRPMGLWHDAKMSSVRMTSEGRLWDIQTRPCSLPE